MGERTRWMCHLNIFFPVATLIVFLSFLCSGFSSVPHIRLVLFYYFLHTRCCRRSLLSFTMRTRRESHLHFAWQLWVSELYEVLCRFFFERRTFFSKTSKFFSHSRTIAFNYRRNGPNGGISLANSIALREKLAKVKAKIGEKLFFLCVYSNELSQLPLRRSQVSQVIAHSDVFEPNNYKNFNIHRLRSPNLPPIEKTMIRWVDRLFTFSILPYYPRRQSRKVRD